jgi:hypothetical protein
VEAQEKNSELEHMVENDDKEIQMLKRTSTVLMNQRSALIRSNIESAEENEKKMQTELSKLVEH